MKLKAQILRLKNFTISKPKEFLICLIFPAIQCLILVLI